jgi:hypothetical protein
MRRYLGMGVVIQEMVDAEAAGIGVPPTRPISSETCLSFFLDDN